MNTILILPLLRFCSIPHLPTLKGRKSYSSFAKTTAYVSASVSAYIQKNGPYRPFSACYPRRTFDPLSDGPSTRHRRITKADFRPCSTGGSCSQAPFCLCTRGPISVWPEETFARLRYLLGGLRPIETVYLRLSLGPRV